MYAKKDYYLVLLLLKSACFPLIALQNKAAVMRYILTIIVVRFYCVVSRRKLQKKPIKGYLRSDFQICCIRANIEKIEVCKASQLCRILQNSYASIKKLLDYLTNLFGRF